VRTVVWFGRFARIRCEKSGAASAASAAAFHPGALSELLERQRRNAKHLWTGIGVSLCNALVIPMAELLPRHVSSVGSSVMIRIRDRQV
jgi:hypothetical protein